MPATFDTVEEYWNWSDIEEAAKRASSDSTQVFRTSLASYLGVDDHAALTLMPSARSGLERLLRQHLGQRRSVLLPEFNCSAVQDAIEAAGGKLRFYDFASSPGLFDWSAVLRMADSTTGAIIVTHYSGVPVDFRSIIDFCQENKVLLIEDCAHTLGGCIGSATAGTLGDAALFSFNYDKPISLGWGGAVLVNNPTYYLSDSIRGIVIPSIAEEIGLLRNFIRAMGERRKAIPRQGRLLEKFIQRLGLHRVYPFTKAEDIGIGAVQAELGLQCLSRYDEIKGIRSLRAERFAIEVPGRTWPVNGDITPAWLKQKVHFSDCVALRRCARRLQRQGVRAGNFNWPDLLSSEGATPCKNATEAATCWMDVPIHQGLTESVLDACIRELSRNP
ncbi:DegT/DnrJ/EryC1/StrS family aminotransferase [Sedimenticola selenatireducens]|uniref:DegT/DnrJ/EryC1/StrS family aminotransferase n=1 Tax=Sedimenticola selenatireducens TaxID=191960 RepID=UPI002AAAD935|nr:DegT/DnrJ/EryC1/StrS family aminotransferase [Sedimenticola selenatireducens]